LEKLRTSASAVDDQLAHHVHHLVEALEGNAHRFRLAHGRRFFAAGHRLGFRFPGLGGRGFRRGRSFLRRRHCGRRFGFRGRQAGDAGQQRLDRRLHRRFVGPLAIEELLERVHRLQADVHDLGAGPQDTVAQAADQVLGAVRDQRDALQPYLRRRALDGVHGAEQAVDVLGVGIRLERQQALGDRLQMLLRFGDEEFQDLGGNIAVRGQVFDLYRRGSRRCFRRLRGRRIAFRRRDDRSLEGERILLLEGVDVLDRFAARVADEQQVGLEHGHGFRDEFDQRSGSIGRDGGVHGVLEDVRQLSGDLGEQREAVHGRRAAQGVGGNEEALDVAGRGIRVLQDSGVLPQELQVLGGFLEEDLDEFLAGGAHGFSCFAIAGCGAAATGF